MLLQISLREQVLVCLDIRLRFYHPNIFNTKNGWATKFNEEEFLGKKLAYDLIDAKTNEVKIKEGTTLYDPNMMEAVVSQELDNVKPNTVLGVISQGFKKGERILRAAKVMISKSPNQDQKEANPSDAPSNGENKDKKEE